MHAHTFYDTHLQREQAQHVCECLSLRRNIVLLRLLPVLCSVNIIHRVSNVVLHQSFYGGAAALRLSPVVVSSAAPSTVTACCAGPVLLPDGDLYISPCVPLLFADVYSCFLHVDASGQRW